MRGRKPKSAERQLAEGDPRKHGTGKLNEQLAATPKATAGFASCPARLKGLAREAWVFWTEELAVMKLDKRPDGPMLEGACWNFARAIQAELILEKDGLTVEDKMIDDDGEVIVLRVRKHPAFEMRSRAWLIVKAFCSEFGLTPVSRTRLTLEDAGRGAEDAELLKALSAPRAPRIPTTAVH